MADYEKLMVRAVFSAYSDYADAKFDTGEQSTTATPTYCPRCGEVKVPTGGIDLMAANEFGTGVDTFFIKNTDSSNYVTVTLKDATGAGTARTVIVGPAEMLLTQNVNVDTAINATADTAACECFVYLSGT